MRTMTRTLLLVLGLRDARGHVVLRRRPRRSTERRLMRRERIRPDPRVQVVTDMDGFGAPVLERDSYRASVASHPVEDAGFKIFLRQDVPLTPARDVLALVPAPLFVVYQLACGPGPQPRNANVRNVRGDMKGDQPRGRSSGRGVRSFGGAVSLASVVLLASGCASAGHLAEYDFRDRPVAVVTVAPPHPDVFTDGGVWFPERGLLEVVVRVAADIVREAEAERARARLDSAVAVVSVAERMSQRVLEQGARQLRGQPVESVRDADFEIELRVQRYGIQADSWDDQARFVIDAEVLLLDGETGREIWKADVDERESVSSSTLGWALPDAVGGAVTAGQLASLSVQEMARALESLADYCADRMVEKLRRGLEKARG